VALRKRTRIVLGVVGVLVVLLIGVRLALPWIVLRVVNQKLAANTDYPGHVEDVDIALIRGAYTLKNLKIQKAGGKAPVPFVDIPVMDLSVEWRALLRKSFVAKVEMDHPVINFVYGKSDAEKQAGTGTDWREELKQLVPLRIDRLDVVDGEIHYADFTSSPPIDVYVDQVNGAAQNLTNSTSLSGSLVATVDGTAHTKGDGQIELHALGDPYADLPTFDLDFQLKNMDLVAINDLFKGYGKFDVESGRMDFFSEIAGQNGQIHGYAKPLFYHIKVFDVKKELAKDQDGPVQVAWEAAVGLAKDLVSNPKKQDVATRVPIEAATTRPSPPRGPPSRPSSRTRT